MTVPSFFNVTPPGSPKPPATSSNDAREGAAAVKERILGQFEVVFPRIVQKVYEGYTISGAVRELPSHAGFSIDYGMFNRWIRKDPTRRALIEEAEEARAEVWADRMIAHAEGTATVGGVENGVMFELDRSKFAFDTYKFLMGRQSRKRYGDTKTIDVTHTISIAAALQQSKQRVIEAMVVDDSLPDDEGEVRLLIAAAGDAEEDSDD